MNGRQVIATPPIPPEALRRAARILVIKLDELGDFILATPFLRGLRASAPQAQIALVVKPPAMALAVNCPDVDLIVTPVDDGSSGRFSFRGRTPEDLQGFAAAFRAGFDIAVTLRFDFDKHGAATLAAASRAPIRLAYAENVTPWKATDNRGFDAAYTHILPGGTARHELEHNLGLLAALGGSDAGDGVDIHLTDAEREAAARLIDAFPGGAPRSLLAVAPTTSIQRRNYPVPRLATLLGMIVRDLAIDGVVLVGGVLDVAETAILTAGLPCAVLDLTGRPGVRELAATIAVADALVGMDSGPAHMAAAVGTPVAVLFCQQPGGDPQSPNAPERFRPWGNEVLVVQPEQAVPPCLDKCVSPEAHCITAIDPAVAAAQIAGFLASRLGRR